MCCCLAGAQPTNAIDATVAADPMSCRACALLALARPPALELASAPSSDPFGAPRLQALARGAVLFRQGDVCRAVYVVRAGGLKCEVVAADGRHQTVGFHLPGELVGLAALGLGRQLGEVQALADSLICVLPLRQPPDRVPLPPLLQRQMLADLGEALQQAHQLHMLLGCSSAQVRLCSFVLELSRRARLQGLSSTWLRLPMTRQDIGSYLGLTVETVSRMLSRLHGARVLEVKRRELRVLDAPALRHLSVVPEPEAVMADHRPLHTTSPALPRWEAAQTGGTGPVGRGAGIRV